MKETQIVTFQSAFILNQALRLCVSQATLGVELQLSLQEELLFKYK